MRPAAASAANTTANATANTTANAAASGSCDPNSVGCGFNCGPNDPNNDQYATCGDPVVRHGARVQHHPLVYLVTWGAGWSNDSHNISTVVWLFMKSLAGTQWNNTLSWYSDGTDYVHNDVTVGAGVYNDVTRPVPPQISATDINNEALQAIADQHWKVTNDTQVLVLPQQGSTYLWGGLNQTIAITGCGQHQPTGDSRVAASVVLYPGDGKCGSVGSDDLSLQQYFTRVTAHEYVEAATDPTGPGFPVVASNWGYSTDNPITDPIEVADKCQGWPNVVTNDPHLVNSPNNWAPPRVWDPWGHTCAQAHGQEFPSPDLTAPYSGVHTVEGGILQLYLANNGFYRTWLGAPLTEELDITPGGRVSYFQGLNNCGGGPTFNGTRSGSAIYAGPPGVFEVDGCIYHHYAVYGETSGFLGFPVSNVKQLSGGYLSYFAGSPCSQSGPIGDNSAIYSGSPGTFYVRGCIYQHYRALGEVNSALGYPVTDETTLETNGGGVIGWASFFDGTGCPGNNGYRSGIYSKSGNAALTFAVQGCIQKHYMIDSNGPWGPLGFPVSDENRIPDNSGNLKGWVSYFEGVHYCAGGPHNSGSAIYSRNGNSAQTHKVQGCIYNKYISSGGPTGPLGFPTDDEFAYTTGAHRSDFDNGSIYDSETGQVSCTLNDGRTC